MSFINAFWEVIIIDSIKSSNDDLPIPLERHLFSVQFAFAMTINKAQGQSLEHVGLDLCTPVSAHGQLYVGLSHNTSANKVKAIFASTEPQSLCWYTLNVIFGSALCDNYSYCR